MGTSSVPAPSTTAAAQTTHARLVLQIHEVKCRDETNGQFVEKIGGDEIDLAGVTIDTDGRVAAVRTLDLGTFEKDGVTKRFQPPRPFAAFDLRKPLPFPRHYQVLLILAERDSSGGLGKFVDGVVAEARKTPIPVAAGGAVAILKPILIKIGDVALAEAKRRLLTSLEDDIFPVQRESVSMADAAFRFPKGAASSARKTLVLRAHEGVYQITFSWQLAG